MEVNKLNLAQPIQTEPKKTKEIIKETGLKEDTFEKKYDIDSVMNDIQKIEISEGQKKFRYPKILNRVKEILTACPEKCEYAAKLAPQENITQTGILKVLEKPLDDSSAYLLKLLSKISVNVSPSEFSALQV